MKKNILVNLFVVLTFNLINAQVIKNGNYRFSTGVTSPSILAKPSNHNAELKSNGIIKVLDINGDFVKYTFWDYTNPKDSAKYNNKIFEMSFEDFETLTTPYYSKYKGVNAGVYTVPFRLRGIGRSNFDFESSLSLQANLVFGFGNTHSPDSWFDASVGIGLTSVNLHKNNSKAEEPRTASAFTVSFGGVFKPAKKVNIGLFVGWDSLGINDKDIKWDFNNKLWLGLGINVSFHEFENDNKSKSKTQTP